MTTLKKHEPRVHVDAEDALAAIDKAIEDKDGKLAATASTDFDTAAEADLAQHP
jgi:hypothetical protein